MLKYLREKSKMFFAHKKLKKSPQKVAYLWQLGGFFSLYSPDFPKHHKTSFPSYKLFFLTISGRISGFNVTMRNFSSVLGPLAWSLRSVSSKICVKATKFCWPFSSQPLLATRACQKAFLFCFLILILVEHVQFIISV
jgi:hypothetical protein